jgi:hypothetical protein
MSMMQLVALSVTPALERPCMALPVFTVLIVFEQAPSIKPIMITDTIFIMNLQPFLTNHHQLRQSLQ